MSAAPLAKPPPGRAGAAAPPATGSQTLPRSFQAPKPVAKKLADLSFTPPVPGEDAPVKRAPPAKAATAAPADAAPVAAKRAVLPPAKVAAKQAGTLKVRGEPGAGLAAAAAAAAAIAAASSPSLAAAHSSAATSSSSAASSSSTSSVSASATSPPAKRFPAPPAKTGAPPSLPAASAPVPPPASSPTAAAATSSNGDGADAVSRQSYAKPLPAKRAAVPAKAPPPPSSSTPTPDPSSSPTGNGDAEPSASPSSPTPSSPPPAAAAKRAPAKGKPPVPPKSAQSPVPPPPAANLTASLDLAASPTAPSAPASSMPPPSKAALPPVPKPLPPPPAAEDNSPEAKEAKRQRIRSRVAGEILSTEQSYVKAMSDMCDMYLTPLQMLTRGDDKDKVLTDKEVKQLFSNAQLITVFNQKLLVDIEAKVSTWDNDTTCLSDVFITLGPFFKMYTQYVGNHDVASELLNKLLRNNKNFIAFHTKCMADPRSTGVGALSSFLIMPIQRVPRYKLLLQELVRNTDEKHVDFANLSKALEEVSKVALHINEAIRSQQNRLNVIAIEQQFGGKVDLVSPSRRFVRQGPLTKKCRNSDKKYEFFLFNDVMLYASKTVGGKFSLHQKIDINSSFVIQDLPDKPDEKRFNSFQVVNAKKSFAVYSDDVAQKTEWIKALFGCIEEQRKAIDRGTAEDFVAPVWQGDKSSNTCVCCDKAFSFLNRRHHCRKCGSLVCDSCSRKRMVIKGKSNDQPQRVCDKCVEQILTAQGKPLPSKTVTGPPDPEDSKPVSDEKDGGDGSGSDQDSDDDSAAPASTPSAASAAPTSPTSPTVNQARALYPYTAVEPTDLTFSEGDIITLLSKDESGWWTGSLNGSTGNFPSNYVVQLGLGADGEHQPDVDKHVVVLLPYTAMNDVELTLTPGDRIHVASQDTSGYYYGTNEETGKAGWFHSANVADATPDDTPATPVAAKGGLRKSAATEEKAKAAPAKLAHTASTSNLNGKAPTAVTSPTAAKKASLTASSAASPTAASAAAAAATTSPSGADGYNKPLPRPSAAGDSPAAAAASPTAAAATSPSASKCKTFTPNVFKKLQCRDCGQPQALH